MLEAIIQSKARIELLKVLLLDGEQSFYLRELVVRTGLGQGSVQRELANLLKAGILVREASGRQTYYKVDSTCPIIPELRSIFIKTVGVADLIKMALQPEVDSIRTAFIFGSFATGKVRSDSDIDLFVIGNITLRKLTALLKSADVSRVINPVVMPEEEFKSRLAEDDHFISTLIKSPKLFLIGSENGI